MSHRCGYVAVIGRPNVGKSTLVNRLVGQKVTIVSRKPQTTRYPVCGIVSRPDAQIVFVDTPGYQTRHGGALNATLNRSVTSSLAGVDAVLFLVEGTRFGPADLEVLSLIPAGLPVVAGINKVDLLPRKDALLPVLQALSDLREFVALVPVSAAEGTQCDALADALAALLPEGPALYDVEQVTDRSERFLAAEIVREKVFRLTGDEIPYGAGVVVAEFEQLGALRRIHCNIIVTRESHKGMVIGRGGARLERIGTDARREMEREFGGRVYLDLRVRVDTRWHEDPRRLRKYGYA